MAPTKAQIDLHSFHSDVFKEVHGFRPRWLRPEEYTVEEWRWMIGLMLGDSQEMAHREAEHEAAHRAWVAEVTDPSPLRVPLAAFMVG